MPVPLPADDTVLLIPPTAEETRETARGVATAASADGALTDVQRMLLEALFKSMTGHAVDLGRFVPMPAHELAEHLARRNVAFRTRGLQVALLAALVLRPLPEGVVDQLSMLATELCVDDGMITVARGFAAGSLGLAGIDFERNGYTAHWHPTDAEVLHTSVEINDAWQAALTDPALATRWGALEDLPDGTLGRRVSQMYRARGFEYPGRPGSAPPLLAQHDWVHVLADYGTTVESELEVFGLIARANDDMYAFSLLAMVVSLFETGYLRAGAGLFEYNVGHISRDPRVPQRIADAMRRGALCHDGRTGSDSVDFLRVDWFELADQPVEAVRELFRIAPKSDEATAAGSVGPWQPGGISEYQLRQGAAMAERLGVAYDSFGATAAML